MVEPRVLLAHGGGGSLTRQLIRDMVVSRFGNPALAPLSDSALLDLPPGRVAFTTDSYVVKPLRFRGGDIGRLAVCGTVNDLAMVGATPLHLSLALILEEGLAFDDLAAVLDSAQAAAAEAGVAVVCGDTKVVERGAADGLFINTSGIGVIPAGRNVAMERAAPGDAVLVSGPIGEHGVAILSERQGLSFETPVSSDVAPLAGLVAAILAAGGEAVHALRDPTRGGLGMVVCEVAEACRHDIELDEAKIPVRPEVRGACDLLGLDPLYVANEGKVVVVCAEAAASAVLAAMRAHPLGRSAARIGRVLDGARGRVTLRTSIGGRRVVDPPYGEQLPRIC
ncbi:MAG TPA: hydrogenase expression/formation protein HypE [Planctomycetota bacterium]|nr:hydrogenase expression/formation protein HypE [Planctomycetota bacterium]HRR82387.1 hydrogenase expression/formation protein HypE [Planctomycetota bacterium]HRT94897.1 hydrogenase expression/formation protein HypE [Planctomycetota bacterium]